MNNKWKLIRIYPGSPELGFILDDTWRSKFGDKEGNYLINGLSFNPENYPEYWEKIEEKEFEILSFIGKLSNSIYKFENNRYRSIYNYSLEEALNNPELKIHSIKRLSDSEIFTIGDKYQNLSGTFTIDSFIIRETVYVKAKEYGECDLNYINKIKKPLFRTFDGVDIFDVNTYYYPVHKHTYYLEEKQNNHHCTCEDKYWIFSAKEAAEAFIMKYKPCLCLNDIRNYIGTYRDYIDVLRIVKSKL